MAFTEPTLLPEWVSDTPPLGPVDPTSSQAAISAPSAAKKGTGFTYQEKPPRQDHNWLFNLIWLWIQWFKQQTDGLWTNQSAVIANAGTTPDIETNQLLTTLNNTFLPRYFLEGFNYSGTSDTLTFFKGTCVGTNGLMINGRNDLSWVSSMAKNINVAWVRGAGGCADPGILPLTNDTWYYVWAVRLANSLQVDFCITNSPIPASALFEPSVTSVRRIGSFKNNIGVLFDMEKLGKYFAFHGNVAIQPAVPVSGGTLALVTCDVPNVNNLKATMLVTCSYLAPTTTRVALDVANGKAGILRPGRTIAEIQVGDQILEGEALLVPIITAGIGYVYYAVYDPTPGGSGGPDPSTIVLSTQGFFDPLDNEMNAVW